MSNDSRQEVPVADEVGADNGQVRPAVVPTTPVRKPPGKDTGMLAAVLDGDERMLGPTSGSGRAGAVGPDGVPYSVVLAQDIRAQDPDFTAEKFQARASGARPTLHLPAKAVIRNRKMRRFAMVATILMIASTATVVTRLVVGVWPWTLLWEAIQAI
jgi:hypothetical protein